MKKLLIFLFLFPMHVYAKDNLNNKGLVCKYLYDKQRYSEEKRKYNNTDDIRIWCENDKCFSPYIKGYQIFWKDISYSFSSSKKIHFDDIRGYEGKMMDIDHILNRENLMLEPIGQYIYSYFQCEVKNSKSEVAKDLQKIIEDSKKKNKF